MYQAMIKKHYRQALEYTYWMGMAIGMIAGASMGVLVGLIW